MRAHIPSSEAGDDSASNAATTFAPDVVYLSPDEWLAGFEREVHAALGIDAAEFVRRYRAGAYEDYDPDVMLFAVSIPMYDAIQAAGSSS